MQQNGWVKLYKKITQWEWYKDVNTYKLFTHLLLTVNNEDSEWRGIKILRGQRVSSLRNLAEECGLTLRQLRTSLDHLKATQEVTQNATHDRHSSFSLFTLKNYSDYQQSDTKSAQKATPIKEDKKKRRKEFIYITDGEMEKLTGVLGPHLEEYLTRLDLYIGSHGDKYKNHYYTLLTWYRKDHPSPTQAATPLPKKYKTSEEIDAEFNALT